MTGKKIDQYWFTANSHEKDATVDKGEAEVHVNVFSPEDQRGIDRYAAKDVLVTDTMALLLSSTFVGNDAKSIIKDADIVDATAGKEFAANKLYLKFIFDASNNNKEYKGVDGKTYVITVKNDTILQAHVKGEVATQDIVYLKHDGTQIAAADSKDSINHQKIVYNKDSKLI